MKKRNKKRVELSTENAKKLRDIFNYSDTGTDFAEYLGIERRTALNILKFGYGMQKNIEKILKKLNK